MFAARFDTLVTTCDGKVYPMQTLRATVTEDGDVNLPEEARRLLTAAGSTTVEVIIREDGVIELRRRHLSLDDVYGILPPLAEATTDFDEQIQAAIDEHVAKKYGQQSG